MSFSPFRLSEKFVELYADKKPPFGFNGLGELVYLRTYSRLKLDGTNEQWYETCRRVVEGTYHMQKRWIEEYSLGWSASRAQKSAQEMYDRMFHMKFLPPGRGLWAMGSPITEERGLFAALNNPLHIDTPILTKEYGWVPIGDILGETVTVLSNTKLYGRDNTTAANAVWVEAKLSPIEKQPCLEITYISKWGERYTVVSSETHRWLRRRNTYAKWERVAATNLNVGDWLPRTKPPRYYKISYQGAQHGFFFGDGTRRNGELHQFGDENIALLDALFPYTDSAKATKNGESHKVARQCPLAWGYLPEGRYLEDQRYLYGFLAGYFAADGSMEPTGAVKLNSARLEELVAVKDLFKRVGVRTSDIVLVSTTSNYLEERELYALRFDVTDLSEDFFLKKRHKQIFREKWDKRTQDWLQIVAIQSVEEEQFVRCVTVPAYEQFVIDGYCLVSNCAFVSTATLKEDLAKPFLFLMDMSMVGVGVGFDTRGAGELVIKGPNSKRSTELMVIPDTREGWVESVRVLLESYFLSTAAVDFDYSQVRKAGTPIKGFGGISAGPEPLIELHLAIRKVLDKELGEPISVTTIVDLMNLIGKAVVAGNVRRTAEIVFGDPTSPEYLDLKNYKVNPARADYGWTSNNSIFAKLGMDYGPVCDRIRLNGEPGVAWLDNMRGHSRMNNGPDNKDHRAAGGNPCLEQTLESYELCCLVETFPDHHKDLDDYLRTLKFAYLYAKTVTLGKTHWPETNRVMLRNRRIGCSVSGVAQFLAKRSMGELKTWLETGYREIQRYDEVYSDWLAIPRSIKTTSVKPSGTVSLVAGATPGAHWPKSRFYLRRMRLSNLSPLVPKLEKAGYVVEPCVGSEKTTVVVEIPVDIGEGVRTLSEVSLWEQLALAAFLQRYWADNQVSMTVTFDPAREGPQLAHALDYYQYQLKGISFLPNMSEGAYPQMPYEDISEEKYRESSARLKKISFGKVRGEEASPDVGCNNDTCEIDFSKGNKGAG